MDKEHIYILVIMVLVVVIGYTLYNSGSIGLSPGGDFRGWQYCTDDSPCSSGVGDCDRDSHCLSGSCVHQSGPDFCESTSQAYNNDAIDKLIDSVRCAEKIHLTSDSKPSIRQRFLGEQYTITLVSATDTSANIRVTDSNGNADNKEISESASKKINGLEVSVDAADESDALNRISAQLFVNAC